MVASRSRIPNPPNLWDGQMIINILSLQTVYHDSSKYKVPTVPTRRVSHQHVGRSVR